MTCRTCCLLWLAALLGGCTELPLRGGQRRSDGRMLIPLLDGGPPEADRSPGSDRLGPAYPVTRESGPPLAPGDGASVKSDVGGGLALTAQEKDLLDAINAARAKNGLSTLTPDPLLMCAARLAAKVVPPSGSCGHVGADGSWPHDRAQSCGMSEQAAWKVNEIAAGPGFNDGADAVWGWSQSSGHWWGLTHPQAQKIGVAGTASGCYWAVFDCCIAGS